MVQILVDAPGRPDMGSVRAIHQLSGGVPLLVEELVKSAFSSGANLRDLATDWNAGAEAVPIPRVVQEAVRKKWTGLRADTRAVLTVAAVMGRSFDFEIVAAVTGLARQALVAAIGEAMAVHLVMEQNSGRLAFRQALVREALYRQILALERRDIHLAVAEALERASGARGEARWEELSYHFFLGEAWDKAVNYALQAAYRCAAMQAQRLVVLHCSRVLDAARWLGQDAPVEVLRMRGMAREALGDFAGALEDLEAALVGASDDPGGRWQAVVDLGTIWSSRDYARCGQYCREALELAHRTRDRQVVARSLNCMGSWLVNVGRIDEGIACHEEARSVFEETGDAAQVTDTLSRLGMAWLAGGNMVKSAQYCRSALGSLEGGKDLRSLASVLISLALCGPSYQGMLSLPGVDPESACQFSQKALALAHDMEWRSGEACALWALGAHELARGRLGSAEEHARGAFQIATESGNLQCMVGASLCLGGVHAEILDYAGAAQHFSEARALAARVGAANLEGILVGLQTACMAEGGDIQAARLTLSTFNVDLPCESLGYRWLWYGRMWLALAEGDNLQALEISRTLCLAAGAEGTAGLPLLERARARGLAGLGRMLEAEATLKKALEDAQGQGLRLVLWRLHFDLGRLYRAAGRHREAAEALASSRQAAAELAGSLPEGPLRRGFLERLARLVPARSGSVGQGVAGLTGRELQVLAMLAQGKSNRSIAEELVVSERTVETHVSSIFRKLGLSSRTQVVAWAFERSPDSPSQ
jgi:DNA-binding CsgD family transcriptional regulator/tetratricopeptide (TPR) repeat protein